MCTVLLWNKALKLKKKVIAAAVDDIVVGVDPRNLCLMFGQNQVM